ncbi:hypothetical protein AMTRI_Chr04g248010 [Amborella trichopoda]
MRKTNSFLTQSFLSLQLYISNFSIIYLKFLSVRASLPLFSSYISSNTSLFLFPNLFFSPHVFLQTPLSLSLSP